MATKTHKKDVIRQEIIAAANIYSQCLAGKTFLYVYGNNYFELSFPIDRFLHLTGVSSRMSAVSFYRNAKKSKLTNAQFGFDSKHLYANAAKKLPCLKRLPELTNQMVCVLNNLQTMTITYKIGVSNLEFTLGLIKENMVFVPMTLRVEKSSVAKSQDGEIVDFIFCKDSSLCYYNQISFQDCNKNIPSCVYSFLDPKLLT